MGVFAFSSLYADIFQVVLLIVSNVFNENYQTIPERDELMDMLAESVRYIMWGFLYKILS